MLQQLPSAANLKTMTLAATYYVANGWLLEFNNLHVLWIPQRNCIIVILLIA